MVKIISVEKGSPAGLAGITGGSSLLSVNGNEINDALDMSFYSADEDNLFVIESQGSEKEFHFELPGPNGIEIEDIKIKHCGNKCIFCFIDQNPPGLRNTLYVKDEDYRFSFMYGNYFTLTNLKEKEIDRIIRMRLSPLYVSVHAFDPEIRKKLLGIKKDDRFSEKLRKLTDNGITVHTQIVLCPGINDGEVLKNTIEELYRFYPPVASAAVVPVGLTGHRSGLPELSPVSEKDASLTLDIIDKFNKEYQKRSAANFVFGSDEFYLKAGMPFPPAEYYEDFQQYEDGVGMARSFIDDFEEIMQGINGPLSSDRKIVILTGELFYPVMKDLFSKFDNLLKPLDLNIIPVKNNLYGTSVTVAGLLPGKDMITALKDIPEGTDVLIPPESLNYDNIFLDGTDIPGIEKETGCRIVAVSNPAEYFYLI